MRAQLVPVAQPQGDGSDSELKAAGNVEEAASQIADQKTFI